MITIHIPGEPVAQGRGRAAMAQGRVRVFDPPKSRNWKATAQHHAMMQMYGKPLFDGPLEVVIEAVWTLPKSKHRKEPRPRSIRWSKPDSDNLAKAVLDSLNGVVWRDDAQAADTRIRKWNGAQGEAPGVTVQVRRLTEAGAPA